MTQGVNSNPPSTSSAALALSAGSGDSCGPAAAAAAAAAPPAPPYSEVDFSSSFADNFVRNRGQPAAAAAANPVQGSRSTANPSPGKCHSVAPFPRNFPLTQFNFNSMHR